MKVLRAACLFLLGYAAPLSSENVASRNPESFDLVWETVNKTHFDPTFGGIDWNAARDRYREKIIFSGGIDAFRRITNQMLYELGLSHLLVATEQMLKEYMPTLFSEGTVGMDVRWMQNRAVVTRIKPGYPGHEAGMEPGYVITRIDGRNVNEIIGRAEAMPPYNERNRRGGISSYLAGHIDGPPGTAVSIAYLDGKSRSRETTILRRSRGAGKIVSDAMPPVFIEFEARLLNNHIGYIRFNHFADPVDRAFVDALETMRDTRGLIFDLRGNPGGYFSVMDRIIEQLVTETTTLYRFRFRDSTAEKRLSPAKHPYIKPVVVLIDATSMSCSELFAACLQAIGRAAVVGERSPGYLLGARWMKLPNGLSFMHTVLQPIPRDGRIVEGDGVAPDIEIGLDRKALLMGKDNQLEAAREHILGKSGP